MANIAKLAIQLTANTTKFKAGMLKAERPLRDMSRKVRRFGKDMEKLHPALSGVGRSIQKLGGKMRAFTGMDLKRGIDNMKKGMGHLAQGLKVVGAGLAAASAGVVALSANMDKAAKMSLRLGVGVEKLTGLHFAAQLSGLTVDETNKALQRMSAGISEAASGTGLAVKALDRLGLSAKELNSLSPDEQFNLIADASQALTNQNDKVKAFMDIFGGRGVSMIQVAENGSAGIRAMSEEAKALGVSFGGEAAKNAERLQDAITRLTASFEGLGNRLAGSGGAAQMMEGFTESITTRMERITSGELGQKIDDFKEKWAGVGKVMAAMNPAIKLQSALWGGLSGAVDKAFGIDDASIEAASDNIAQTRAKLEAAYKKKHGRGFGGSGRSAADPGLFVKGGESKPADDTPGALGRFMQKDRSGFLNAFAKAALGAKIAAAEVRKNAEEAAKAKAKEIEKQKEAAAYEKELETARAKSAKKMEGLLDKKKSIEKEIKEDADKRLQEDLERGRGGTARAINTGLMALSTGIASPSEDRGLKENKKQTEKLKEVVDAIKQMNKDMETGRIAFAF
jgi:hypothetical protein